MQQNAKTQITLLPGDAIERQGPAGTMHRGIFAGVDYLGQAWVIHNAKDQCVKWDLLTAFAEGQTVRFLKRVARNIHEQNLIVARAESKLGKKFDLWKFNCDHLVTYALSGVAESPQLGTVAAIALLAAACGIAAVSAG